MAKEDFREDDVRELLVACHRRCCICHVYCGVKMEIDHIVPRSSGGPSTKENAIPVCFDCHAEIHHYNVRHPRGRKFAPDEIRGHKEQWLAICAQKPSALTKGRDVRVGPLQAMVDELEYNTLVAERYTRPKEPLGGSLALRQFHRAIAAGAIGVLDDDVKATIYAAYAAADAANQQLIRDHEAVVRNPSFVTLENQRTHGVMGQTAALMRVAREALLRVAVG